MARKALLPEYTFMQSDITVRIKRLGPFTIDEIQAKLKKQKSPPQPPEIWVSYGDSNRLERNFADPAYAADKAIYDEWLQERMGEELLELICSYSVVPIEDHSEEIQSKREMLELIHGKEAADLLSDMYIFVRHVCILSSEALVDFRDFVLGRSHPTPEVVQEHLNAFPGNV